MPARDARRLAGSGLVVVNPPWTLADELAVLLPALAQVFAGAAGRSRLDWLAGEMTRGAAEPPLSSAPQLIST